jgi:Dyp-type peroxidase family
VAKLVSSKHLEGVSDLTLKAPVRKGFIDAFESVTYETRLRAIMKALSKIRSTAREYTAIKPFAETTEQIQSLLDFRLAIVDGEQPTLFLSATFDRPFEPYMRLIWNPLGPFLDVIFCNCEGYVLAAESSFEDYLAWIRSVQIDTDIFYAASGRSVMDVEYLAQVERRHREAPADPSIAMCSFVPETPTELARQVRTTEVAESNKVGVEALIALYKLADFYPADRLDGDGRFLVRATQQLLDGWAKVPGDLPQRLEEALREQLTWYRSALPPLPPPTDTLAWDADRIQGGIISGYGGGADPVLHGALLLMRIDDAEAARRFVGTFPAHAEGGDAPAGHIWMNLAFTRHGLINIGVPEAAYARLPQEFREGMEDRAGLLGDLRQAHPRNWALPKRNWQPGTNSAAAAAPVELSEVDIVIQLRSATPHDGHDALVPGHPLHDRIAELAGAAGESGIRLLAVETMRRASSDPGPGRDHFGFLDGLSQPVMVDAPNPAKRDEVRRGEIFRGYVNDRGDPPVRDPLLDNGTFLVIRKLRQRPGLDAFAEAEAKRLRPKHPGITAAWLLAKMMGRDPDGIALTNPSVGTGNDFDYELDKGERCPLQAHIRRTNPRTREHSRPTPRILRRGLSYGPRQGSAEEGDRGIFFMAYNASIAEQFEVIQRWVNGGNSTGVASCQSDPLMGPAVQGDSRTFRFLSDAGKAVRVDMPKPFVELQWGTYLFVPSIDALKALAAGIPAPATRAEAGNPALRKPDGATIVASLLALAAQGEEGRRAAAAAWKTHLEDFGEKDPGEKARGPAVWAAIRDEYDGAIRVPYPDHENGGFPRDTVLVASKAMVMRVFQNADGHYSMAGQMKRMRQSFGEIFLGEDDTPSYHAVADPVNAEIMKIDEATAFDIGYRNAAARLEQLLAIFCMLTPGSAGQPRSGQLDLRREFIMHALGRVCHECFDIPDVIPVSIPPEQATYVELGGWAWGPPGAHPTGGERMPRCPGDYLATSRYCFYPDPVPAVQQYGQKHGQALFEAVWSQLTHLRATGGYPKGLISNAIAPVFTDDAEFARTLIGVMTGFLPPADGSLRWTLYDWLEEKTLWRLQQRYVAATGGAYDRARVELRGPLVRAMQKRPSPDMLWRTASTAHHLGPVHVQPDDKIIIGIVSAMAEDSERGLEDVYPVFGGNRRSNPHPLHACPASRFGMGVMMGILAALFDKVRIEALPAPMLVRITDWTVCPPRPPAAASGPPPPAAVATMPAGPPAAS